MIENIMDYSFEALLQIDTGGRVTYFNAEMQAILDRKPDEIYGRFLWELIPEMGEKDIRRVLDDRQIPVDVRIIAATNRNLYKEVKEGKFREDLYYRLNVLTLAVPPLRERGNDIRLLTETFLDKYGRQNDKRVRLTDDAMEVIEKYSWPGNARQLRNFCERLVIISDRKIIDRKLLESQLREIYQEEGEFGEAEVADIENHINDNIHPCESRQFTGYAEGVDREKESHMTDRQEQPFRYVSEEVEDTPVFMRRNSEWLLKCVPEEAVNIMETLERFGGNRNKTAEHLGMGRATLWRKMKKYGLDRS